MINLSGHIRDVKLKLIFVGEIFELIVHVIKGFFTKPFYFQKLTEQLVYIGIGSIPITAVIGFTTGLIMTLQFGHGLAKFGGTLYTPSIVALSILRELGPIFTSILVAGRIGSGIAAEIGSMNVSQQVDALKALGVSPVRYLIVPRVLAAMISLPLLTSLADILGLLGGLLIAVTELNIPMGFYIEKILDTSEFHDYFSGLVKSVFFGMAITIVACFKGIRTRGGTKGVGQATTWVVVYSSIFILISDFFISKLFVVLWLD